MDISGTMSIARVSVPVTGDRMNQLDLFSTAARIAPPAAPAPQLVTTTDSVSAFAGLRHPCLAIACPNCHVRAGAWCKRPSDHEAMGIHKSRRQAADALWVAEGAPMLDYDAEGLTIIREPTPEERRQIARELADISTHLTTTNHPTRRQSR